MPWTTLAFEQVVQWKFGLAGGVSASLMAAGYKLGNTKCMIIGCTGLALILGSGGHH
ncbi:hypothetical protein [Streptomyces sp. NPDC058382]|uniref:hypothetical protein n=1 Tax=unclassified Streptomyces TaxID=2593676 RepID=UPI00362D4A0D